MRFASALVLSGLLLSLPGAPASAQSWPTHAIKVIVPFPAGGFADAAARTLTYDLTPPNTESGPKNLIGIAMKDNVISAIRGEASLNQVQVHPADISADLQLTSSELAAYAAAWLNGSPWPTGPSPIEVSFVTRGGLLVQGGGAYTVNPLAKLPLAWVPAAPVPPP